MLFGIEEPVNYNSEENSIFCINDIFHEIGVYNVNISKAYRIGYQHAHKPRPVKITIEDTKDKHRILKNAYKLKESRNYSNVFLATDVTLSQRIKKKLALNKSAD